MFMLFELLPISSTRSSDESIQIEHQNTLGKSLAFELERVLSLIDVSAELSYLQTTEAEIELGAHQKHTDNVQTRVHLYPDIVETQGSGRLFTRKVPMKRGPHLNIAPAFSFALPNAGPSPVSSRSVLQEHKARRYNGLLQALRSRRSSATTLAKPKCRSSPLLMSMNSASGTQGKGGKGDTALLVVDHGSKRTEANTMLHKVAQELQNRTSIPVYFAHMELASPTIAEGMQLCVKNGAKHVIVVPFFLSPGRHVTSDVPQLTAEAAQNLPHVSYEVKPPIGTHPGIIELILDCAGLLSG